MLSCGYRGQRAASPVGFIMVAARKAQRRHKDGVASNHAERWGRNATH